MTPKEMLKLTIDLLLQAGERGWTKKMYWKVDDRPVKIPVAKGAPNAQCCMVGRVVLETEHTISEVEGLLFQAVNRDRSPTSINDNAQDFNSLIITLQGYLENA